jgi:hypothetical protein
MQPTGDNKVQTQLSSVVTVLQTVPRDKTSWIQGKTNFSFHDRVDTGFEAHTICYSTSQQL